MITYMFSNLDNVPSHFPPVAESRYNSRQFFLVRIATMVSALRLLKIVFFRLCFCCDAAFAVLEPRFFTQGDFRGMVKYAIF